MRKFVTTILATSLFATSAMAATFYERNSGQWTVRGQTAEPGLNPVCLVGTRWQNGAVMRLIQDLADDELYIYYENPGFNIVDNVGSKFAVTVLFDNQSALMGEYEVAGRTSIRIRNISHDVFLPKFAAANVIEFRLPGNMPSIKAGLTGTRNAMGMMSDCIRSSVGVVKPAPMPSKPGIML